MNHQTRVYDNVFEMLPNEEMKSWCARPAFRRRIRSSSYGDNNTWFAAYGFWLFKMYGHKDVRLMNGGRQEWLNESDKQPVSDKPSVSLLTYKAGAMNVELRAKVAEVMAASQQKKASLVDIRSPDEYTGKVIAPPGMSETAQRGGHIPGAKSVPWSTAVNADGTFKPVDELKSICLDKAPLIRTKKSSLIAASASAPAILGLFSNTCLA
jgi:thiosulfate/3-mercaptopyruvate sulfurtransferase